MAVFNCKVVRRFVRDFGPRLQWHSVGSEKGSALLRTMTCGIVQRGVVHLVASCEVGSSAVECIEYRHLSKGGSVMCSAIALLVTRVGWVCLQQI